MSIITHAGSETPSVRLTRRILPSQVFKWLGRGISLLLLLLWGAFFAEHVNEWYLHPSGGYPPLWVLASMVFHFGILVGLLVSLRWGLLGTAITLAATAAFFGNIGFSRALSLSLMPVINLAPAACFAAAWLLGRHESNNGTKSPK